jgi:hypothetical protein
MVFPHPHSNEPSKRLSLILWFSVCGPGVAITIRHSLVACVHALRSITRGHLRLSTCCQQGRSFCCIDVVQNVCQIFIQHKHSIKHVIQGYIKNMPSSSLSWSSFGVRGALVIGVMTVAVLVYRNRKRFTGFKVGAPPQVIPLGAGSVLIRNALDEVRLTCCCSFLPFHSFIDRHSYNECFVFCVCC